MSKNIKGFTLAEILVTLGIIGIIASMTIPNLVQDVQDAQLKTAWKKTYADLNQTLRRVAMDNSGSIKNICTDNNCLRNLYMSYLTYSKVCNNLQSWGNCWHNGASKFWYLDGTGTTDWGDVSGLIMNNGTLLQFWNASKTCTWTGAGVTKCGTVHADINGFKGPNRIGKDIFSAHITDTNLIPFGVQGDLVTNKCEGSTGLFSGWGCSVKYLYQ